MAHTFEELPLSKEVRKFSDEVTAILQTPALRRNRKLLEQIEDALESIESNLEEGFQAPTDAAFENFVFIAKGSTAEVLNRLKQARNKGKITEDQYNRAVALGEPLGRMLGGFIKYLAKSGFTDRGRHSVAPTPRRPFSRPRK
jgi:four helix bundle protein